MSKDITSNDIWKWGDGSETPISEMNKLSVVSAALHSMKKMHYYSNQIHYCDYKIKTASNDKQVEKFERKKEKSDETVFFFATKFEQLEERAKELGMELPDKFEDMKKYKDLVREEVKEETKEQ